jgi:hypothetical protein
LAVYTSFDMVLDCRNGRTEGWSYFVRNFVEPLRFLLRHYARPAEVPEAEFRSFLKAFHSEAKSFFDSLEPVSERQFLMSLRPRLLAVTRPPAETNPSLDLEILDEAFPAYTATERQMVWLETMGYTAAEIATLMRAAPETVEKLRARNGELLRSKLDRWSDDVLQRNGRRLGEAAAARVPEHPAKFRDLTDLIDGRITWQRRNEIECLLVESWYNVHQLCCLREADHAIHVCRPLDGQQAEPYLALLGIEPPKPGLLKRLLGAR